MIKSFSSGDIAIRPFKTFKHWEIQSVDVNGVDAFGRSTWFGSGSCEVNRGQKIRSIFYASGSSGYNVAAEPVNPSGKYYRNIYSMIDAMFYRFSDNLMEQFGLENPDHEVRRIGNKVVAARIAENVWGEKIVPNSVCITDNANINETYHIQDDGSTNLFVSGNVFIEEDRIGAHLKRPPELKWNPADTTFYTINGNVTQSVTPVQAKSLMEMGVEVFYTENSGSWYWDYSHTSSVFDPQNERFGQAVSAWYKYIAVGSPMDTMSLAPIQQGYASIFKFDTGSNCHRLLKDFYAVGEWSSSLDGSFGHAVCVRDNFLVVGAPSGSVGFGSVSGSGFVYIYDRFKSGFDNWGLINVRYGDSTNDQFGHSVALSNDILAVGAPGWSGSIGAVYVYRRKRFMDEGEAVSGPPVISGQPQSQQIDVGQSANFSVSEDFGTCESIPTTSFWPTFGQYGPPLSADETSSATFTALPTPSFVSGNHLWVYETTLTSSVAVATDQFGWALDIYDNALIVGCRRTLGPGFAELFICNYVSASLDDCPTGSWSESLVFRANESLGNLVDSKYKYATPALLSFDGFGRAVTLNGDNLAISSYYDLGLTPYGTTSSITLGAVYLYNYQPICSTGSYNINVFPAQVSGAVPFDFVFTQKLFGELCHTSSANFGRSISLNGNRLAISSENHWASQSYQVDYTATGTGSYTLDGQYYASSNPEDAVLGRVSLYTQGTNYSWSLVNEARRNKDVNQPYNVFGKSVALASDFLAVGAPIYNFVGTGSNYSQSIEYSRQISASFPVSYSGSVFVYGMNDLKVNPLIGNVFYKNGYFVITSTSSKFENTLTGTGSRGFDLKFQGTHTIFEHEYLVSVNPGEFNYSTNPTALVKDALLFDVNQDGIFDFTDLAIIMRYLNGQTFYAEVTYQEAGVPEERGGWWNNSLLTEARDVLLQEQLYLNSASAEFTLTAYNYIQTNLVDTGILDIDGNGVIDIRDGAMLTLWFTDTLTPKALTPLLDANSTRIYVATISTYIGQYTGENEFDVNPMFFGYQASSSFDPSGSYLAPYITSIGLYDANSTLLAVGKLGKPIKNLIDWPINFIVRFDT